MAGRDMTRRAAEDVYRQSGLTAQDAQVGSNSSSKGVHLCLPCSPLKVVELHDCFSANELITYEALKLCGPGEAGRLVAGGDTTYGGRWVVNPSGGLISKGHPLGATGLAQCSELCWQLRGMCGNRQVPNCKVWKVVYYLFSHLYI